MQTHDARRLDQLQRQLDEERRKRLHLESQTAGLRSAIVRLQAKLAERRADDGRARAEQPPDQAA